MAWLDRIFGAYPWPQMTNVHRLEGGGTEFPMMMGNGNPSLGLILHEAGHNYVMGVLANNEWREGFLDEGFTSYQTTRYFLEQGDSARYHAAELRILGLDLDGRSQPVSYPSHAYRDFATYNAMIYARGELFFHRLHALVGAETMGRILRTYYARWKLRHVDEAAFRQVAEEVSGRNLSSFFGQWLHGNVRYDYAIRKVRSNRTTDGRWITRVQLERREDGVLPVEVLVRTPTDRAWARAEGYATRETVTLLTEGRPVEVVLDPDGVTHDWNMLNNRQRRGLLGWYRAPKSAYSIDRLVSTPVYRDRRATTLLPTVWYNDAGGVTAGFQARSNYLGRFNRLTFRQSMATRLCCERGEAFEQWQLRLENPTALYAPGLPRRSKRSRSKGGGAPRPWSKRNGSGTWDSARETGTGCRRAGLPPPTWGSSTRPCTRTPARSRPPPIGGPSDGSALLGCEAGSTWPAASSIGIVSRGGDREPIRRPAVCPTFARCGVSAPARCAE